MTRGLKIASNLTLDPSYVTKTAAILAQRRVGKTYTASVIAEEMVESKLPFVVLDPTGAWWGLRSHCPVVILGGQYGDIPLERTGGALVADLVVDHPSYYIIDFSLFQTKAADRQFATDFAERLYRRKANKPFPLHLFVDEADVFVPQSRADKGDMRMLGAFEAIVRRGGIRGLGTTLISQRAAVVNKNVLTQLDMLIVLRTMGPTDRSAIDDYVKTYGTGTERQLLMDSLTTLDLGQAWFWEPAGQLFKSVRVRKRRTFNSSATPKVGEKRVEPKTFAAVDLEAVREGMAATIEKADADDPVKLRARIKELERNRQPQLAPATVEVEVERIPDALPAAVMTAMHEVLARPDVAKLFLIHLREDLEENVAAVFGEDFPEKTRVIREAKITGVGPATSGGTGSITSIKVPTGSVKLGKNARTKILQVLAQYPDGLSAKRLAAMVGMSPKKSTLGIAIQKLKREGLVEGTNELLVITEAGSTLCPLPERPTGPELVNHWRSELGTGAARRLFDVFVSQPTADWADHRLRLSAAAQVDPDASTFGIALQKLRRLGLVVGFHLDPDFAEAIR